jgi:hypothetical protein
MRTDHKGKMKAFKCTDCKKIVCLVKDIRNCLRCQSNGSAASIWDHHDDSDWLTHAILGYALDESFSSHETSSKQDDSTTFSGEGGLSNGAGASGSWDDSKDNSEDSSLSSDSGSPASDGND